MREEKIKDVGGGESGGSERYWLWLCLWLLLLGISVV